MKTPIVLLSALLIFSIGCTKETIPKEVTLQTEILLAPLTNYCLTDDLPEISTLLKGATKPKTIKFHEVSGTIEFLYFNAACKGNHKVLILGEGNASHIGRYTVLNTYCVDSDGKASSNIYGFITAANEDEIHTQMVGSGVDPELGLVFSYIILGGTGRFEGATGNIRMYGSMIATEWTLKGEGTIIY